MVPSIIIIGLFIIGIFNLKIRQIALTLLFLLLLDKKFRNTVTLLIKVSLFSLHKKSARSRAFRISKRFISKKLRIAT